MPRIRKTAIALCLAGVAAVALAACGGDDSSSTTTASQATSVASGGSQAGAISVQSIDGSDVLVDSQGQALYTNNMDTGSKIACTGECTSIWIPVKAPSGGQPTSDDSSVKAELGTVDTPDGTTQVTFDGKPLYTFAEDSSGQVSGDGVSDSFGGVSFSWTVATPSGGGSSSDSSGSAPPTTTDSGSGGSGSYGY
jgi:predicted lipoprotein with Yx(FWY)xxD motif